MTGTHLPPFLGWDSGRDLGSTMALMMATTNRPVVVCYIKREPEPVFTPDWGRINRMLQPAFTTWDPHDPLDPRAVRRRYQENLAKLRGREPAFVHAGLARQGKRAAGRWGARSREQRERKTR